jgi:hypothetical protein
VNVLVGSQAEFDGLICVGREEGVGRMDSNREIEKCRKGELVVSKVSTTLNRTQLSTLANSGMYDDSLQARSNFHFAVLRPITVPPSSVSSFAFLPSPSIPSTRSKSS